MAAENQANVAGGDGVIASTQPNLLTQIGSNGPVSFTVGFSICSRNLVLRGPNWWPIPLSRIPPGRCRPSTPWASSWPRPNAPQIFSYTNVQAQTYTLSSADGIASVVFSSEGTGLTTFNAMLLDDFILTPATQQPAAFGCHYQSDRALFVSARQIPTSSSAITFEVEPSATVTNVSFYAAPT